MGVTGGYSAPLASTMAKRQAPEKWVGDGRSPARRDDAAEAYRAGFQHAAFLLLGACYTLTVLSLVGLVYADKLSGAQMASVIRDLSVVFLVIITVLSGKAHKVIREARRKLLGRLEQKG